MVGVSLTFEQLAAADPLNDTLASYILESDVSAARARAVELPALVRYFLLKVGKGTQNRTVGKDEFAALKKLITNQNDELRERAFERTRAAARDKLGVEIGLLRSLAPHYEEEDAIALSTFIKVTGDQGTTAATLACTSTYLNVTGRLLFLYSYGQQEDLEWTRTASRDWAKRIMTSNTQPPPKSPGGRFDWDKIMERALAGGLMGGLIALIVITWGWLRRRIF